MSAIDRISALQQRIATLEAALHEFISASKDRATYDLREAGYLRTCHELEAAIAKAEAALDEAKLSR